MGVTEALTISEIIEKVESRGLNFWAHSLDPGMA